MNSYNKALLALALVSILLFSASLYFFNYATSQVVETTELPLTLKVEQSVVGFNLDSDALHFGTISINGSSRRAFFYESDKTGYLYLTAPDVLKDFLYLPQNFNHSFSGEKRIEIIAKHDREGYYEGDIRIYLLKTEPSRLMKLFLGQNQLKKADIETSKPGVSITI